LIKKLQTRPVSARSRGNARRAPDGHNEKKGNNEKMPRKLALAITAAALLLSIAAPARSADKFPQLWLNKPAPDSILHAR